MYFGNIDYVHRLIHNGQRHKARAFWEYCYDMEHGIRGTNYLSSWGVSMDEFVSWVDEFDAAIGAEIESRRERIKEQFRRATR